MPARRPLHKRLLSKMLRHPLATGSVVSFSYRLAKNGVELAVGSIDHKEFRARAGENFGAVSLGAAGSHLGRLAGNALPGAGPLGPVIGSIAGMTLGEALGSRLGRISVVAAEAAAARKRFNPDLHIPKKSL